MQDGWPCTTIRGGSLKGNQGNFAAENQCKELLAWERCGRSPLLVGDNAGASYNALRITYYA